jgi:hypothetical protein
MRTECAADIFDFASVEGRQVKVAFDGGSLISDGGALLLGGVDRVLRLVERFAGCFQDNRRAGLVEHEVQTLVVSARSAKRWATRTSTITTGCGTIR